MRSYKVFAVLALAALTVAARADELDDRPGLSREMKIGIRYYEKGDDLQAMDRFMNVLTKGDPAERSMANEYINLITRRMNSGEKNVPNQPSSLRPNETTVEAAPTQDAPKPAAPAASPEVVIEHANGADVAAATPAPPPARLLAPMPATPPVSADAEPPRADKNVMKKEIKAKIRALLEQGLRQLHAYPDIKVLMLENGDPEAIAIPTPLLFQQGIAFQRDSTSILEGLTKVAFSLGTAQVIILPEGTPTGDAKVLDMRRTMGISSTLLTAGVAAPRVRVNLLNSQVDIPKPLLDFRGVIVLFAYNQPLGLVVENTFGEEGGPPLSLGVYPTTIRPERGEGSIIEFSVQDPPAGLVSWKFQLLQPAQAEGRDLSPLQEVVGGSPVFHQVYWNGHQNYFGPRLPPGRYECVLTATDANNRQRALHRWIEVVDSSGLSPKLLAEKAAPAASPSGPPPTDLSGESKAAPLIKEEPAKVSAVELAPKGGRALKRKAAPKKSKAVKRKASAPAQPADEAPQGANEAAAQASESASPAAAAAAVAPNGTRPATTVISIDFNKNTHQLTPEGERKLAGVADTMVYYPLENLTIEGSAQSGETGAAQLAERRAQMVAGLLINKYQVEPKRIRVSSRAGETAVPRVQITFVKSDQ